MGELVTVHRASETEAPKIVAYLENRCLHPVVLDDGEKLSAYRRQSHEIRIAVPQAERDAAARILAKLERQEQLRLFPVIERANAVFFVLIAVLALLAVVGLLDAKGWWFAGLWMLLTVVIAAALIRWAWGGKPRASAGERPRHRRRS